ncbi:hypothetical protein PPS11_27416 [Pseudomonas putida S11]|nr:hypothetical protein PPS11_27416 [Pseudomonas putida S11]
MTLSRKTDGGLLSAGGGVGSHAAGVQGADIDVHASARLDHVDNDEADDQGDRGDDFEVQQRVAASLADRLHALHAGDAADHGAEDDRGDDHLDQFDEAVPQGFEGDARLRIVVAEQDTDGDGDQHLDIQGFVQRLTCRHG